MESLVCFCVRVGFRFDGLMYVGRGRGGGNGFVGRCREGREEV